jgi:5-methyltetrahydropteroyltriglutamate--homocysteine methyltransferase
MLAAELFAPVRLLKDTIVPFQQISVVSLPYRMVSDDFSRIPMHLFPTAVIGSLPRPNFVRELILPRGEAVPLTPDRERALEAHIRSAVAFQEQAGIDVISDGEWRRVTFFDVLVHISGGFRLVEDPLTKHLRTFIITERLKPHTNGYLSREVAFLRSITDHPIKVALPSPALLGERMWHPEYSREAYATREAFVEACIPLLRKELQLAAQVGASVIQIDDPHLCIFVDEDVRRQYENPDASARFAVDMINALVEDVGAYVAVHLCRRAGARSVGARAFRGTFEWLLPHLNALHVRQLALEFTAPGSGEVSVLKELRSDFDIGLGCLSVHHGHIDSTDIIVERVESALQHVAKERITLTPDCGFAPSATVLVPLDEVYEKLCNLSEAARILRERHGAAARDSAKSRCLTSHDC